MSIAKHTITNEASRMPATLAPLKDFMVLGRTARPRVRDTTAPENLRGLGMSLDSPFASLDECFINGGVIALMMKQKAPANGFSCALIVAPFTWLPTLAYRIDSTPRPHIAVPLVGGA